MSFLKDLKSYLEQKGFGDIYRDYKPDDPDSVICLFVYAHASDGDGSGMRHVQVQVRDPDPDIALSRCWQISSLLDSGQEEEQIYLTEDRHTICRPTARPKRMGRDEQERSTYYCEIAVWSEDKE